MSAASQSPDHHLITPSQLALRWNLNLNTLSQWRAAGTGPKFIRLGDGNRPRIRYRMSDIISYERESAGGKK